MQKQIRNFLKEQNLDALLITRTDSFLGEYYPPEKKQLEKATGFTGSAGLALFTKDKSVLFVDSRYTEQAKIETDMSVYEIPTQTTVSAWIQKNLPKAHIGYNPWQRSVSWVEFMNTKDINLAPVEEKKWETLFPSDADKSDHIFDYNEFCGETTVSKIQKVIQFIKQEDLDAYIFTSPDSVSWLLNKRNKAIPEYPVIFTRLVVWKDGTYQELTSDFQFNNIKIGIDINETPMALFSFLQQNATIKHIPDIVQELKAVKNATECQNIRQTCFYESQVICRFLAWIEQNKETIDELACDKKLKELRTENTFYIGDSFDTIAAVGEHAARAHYQATKETNVPITSASILLVDTGGNYLTGTTDMTRTIYIAEPTPIIKKRYTQVLKGHIALATTSVKEGDTPVQLDKNARQFLRNDGVDYGHSTGHGIGMLLSVHEAPPYIYEKSETPLKAGMLFSNEPAFYDAKEGYGIRLENMILTDKGPDDTLILENLLWIPFDGRLVDFDLLTTEEKKWLKSYHNAIRVRILPNLSRQEQETLIPLLDFFD